MDHAKEIEQEITRPALIYCRVSDRKQRLQGSGLDSQEQRCRKYADEHGYNVEMVFPDDVSGGGDFMKRPGMRAMLAYLEAQSGKAYVVIFDDLKRFARDTQFHLALRGELASRGAGVECLNFKFEDTPEGMFVETIFAAQGQLEREQNRRQVVQKMKARVESGFWVFRAPVGYKHVPAPGGGGKVLVPDEPLATVVREALEGYANGRFTSQAEVQRYFESNPYFPKDFKDGSLRAMTVSRLLKKVVYAGYVEAPKWAVNLRKGQHEGLISFETWQRIQDNLEDRKRAPAARKDYDEDFPLRGFVRCGSCGNAMTAAWSTGCRKRYAYYRCMTRGCDEKSKSVPRARLESVFEDILKAIVPTKRLLELAKAMFADAWDIRLAKTDSERSEWRRQLTDADKQIENLLDKIVDAQSTSVIRRFEERINELEKHKLLLEERVSKPLPKRERLEECMELSLKFLSSPWEVYEKGSHAAKQLVLRLAFSTPLTYHRKEMYGTTEFSFPFKVLEKISGQKSEMVLPERFELSTSPLPRGCSTPEPRQLRGGISGIGAKNASPLGQEINLPPVKMLMIFETSVLERRL